MTKEEAISLIGEYCVVLKNSAYVWHMSPMVDSVAVDAAGMSDRFPPDGSAQKAMRWLGYLQGICASHRIYTLAELKEHARRGWVAS